MLPAFPDVDVACAHQFDAGSGDEVACERTMGVDAEYVASDFEEEEDTDVEEDAVDDEEVEARRGDQVGILRDEKHAGKQGNDEGGVRTAREEAARAEKDFEADAHEAGDETGSDLAAGVLHRGGKLVGDFAEDGQQLVFVGMFVPAPPSDPLVRSVCRTPNPKP